MAAALIALITGAVIIAVILVARWIDMPPAQKAFRSWKRAHRAAQRQTIKRMTVLKLPNEWAQIIGDGAWR